MIPYVQVIAPLSISPVPRPLITHSKRLVQQKAVLVNVCSVNGVVWVQACQLGNVPVHEMQREAEQSGASGRGDSCVGGFIRQQQHLLEAAAHERHAA